MMLEIEGKITGKARPRFTRFGNVYTPKNTMQYEKQIYTEYKRKYGNQKINGATEISITAYFHVPKSYRREQKQGCLNGSYLPTKKPDSDNIAKVVLDALNGVAYIDDKDVVKLTVTKEYTEREQDYLIVRIEGAK